MYRNVVSKWRGETAWLYAQRAVIDRRRVWLDEAGTLSRVYMFRHSELCLLNCRIVYMEHRSVFTMLERSYV